MTVTSGHPQPEIASPACDLPATPTIGELWSRRSVRAYTDEPVSPRDERQILLAACQAPTAGNQQLYSIVVARDQRLKDELAHTCDDQPFIAKAPLVLVFCADVRRWWRAFRAAGADPRDPGVGDLMLAVTDATIAAQNAVVAAESLGIGSCYIGDVLERAEKHRELLSLPDHVVPCCMLALGHPTDQQLARPKPRRFDLADVVFEDRYTDPSDDELRDALACKQGHAADGDKWVRAFCERKWNSGFSREMTRSVGVWLDGFAR